MGNRKTENRRSGEPKDATNVVVTVRGANRDVSSPFDQAQGPQHDKGAAGAALSRPVACSY